MSFKVIKTPVFITTAKIVTPTEAEPVVQHVQVKFQWVEDGDKLSVDKLLDCAVLELFDLVDEAGNALAFADIRSTLLVMPEMRLGLFEAYYTAYAEARAKN